MRRGPGAREPLCYQEAREPEGEREGAELEEGAEAGAGQERGGGVSAGRPSR